MARRGRGEGSIRRHKKSGLWEARVVVGPGPDGKPRRISRYFEKREEAQKWLATTIADRVRGVFVEPSKVTLGEWLDTWLREYKRPPKTRPTTWQNYEYLVRVHIKPAIGHVQLRQLQPSHLQRLYNEKAAKGRADGTGGLSARTVRLIHTILHSALKQAIKEGLVVRNVAEATTLPKQEKKKPRVLTLEEQARFFSVLEQDRLGAAFLLDLATGMRRGELLGLKWEDVDLKEGIIRVERELVRVKDPDTGKGMLTYQKPKSEKGRRTIPLPNWAVAALKAHRVRQAQEKLLAGPAWEENGLVFATADGKPVHPRNFTRSFYRLVERAGIGRTNLHALRHSYATRLLEMNEHPKVVQELLGHSQISVTLDTYSHVLPEVKKQAAAKLEGLYQTEAPSTRGDTAN